MTRVFAAAATALLLASCTTPQPRSDGPVMAITIDDLPVHGGYPPRVTPNAVNEQMIAALREAGVDGATGFVNAANVAQQPDTIGALNAWRSAGAVLANHGWAHRGLSSMSLTEFEAELTRNEPVLEKLGQGTDWRWFRYPFLDEGKDAGQRIAARQILAKHGYRVAAVTFGFGDWQWTAPYARCMTAGDQTAVAELERMYIDAAKESIVVGREQARQLYGRDIPYVLLMHVSPLSARMMPRLIQLYRDAGFRFVSVGEAESDAVYKAYTDPNLPPPAGPAELARQKGVELRQPTDYSARLQAMCPAAPS